MNKKVVASMLWLAVSVCCVAQVSNNSIQNRIALRLDAGWFYKATILPPTRHRKFTEGAK